MVESLITLLSIICLILVTVCLSSSINRTFSSISSTCSANSVCSSSRPKFCRLRPTEYILRLKSPKFSIDRTDWRLYQLGNICCVCSLASARFSCTTWIWAEVHLLSSDSIKDNNSFSTDAPQDNKLKLPFSFPL